MKYLFLSTLMISSVVFAQNDQNINLKDIQKIVDDTLTSKWYEKIFIKGYAQFRYNRVAETNSKLTCGSCDKSIGDRQGLFMRRARLVFFGEINDKVYFYVQPDYASDANNQNYFQIRDAYFDYNLFDYSWRVRTGISKVPYGFVNLQSSSIRGPLDRDDALNSGVPNERDLGVFLMYAPQEMRKRFKELAKLKGSGDYGLFSIGAYNGQTVNKKEQNNDLHRFIRFTYPFRLKNGQFIEASIQAYEGKFFIEDTQRDYLDTRQAVSFIVYPRPWGFQFEYNIGIGPEYDTDKDLVETKNLKGGYAQLNYQFENQNGRFFPYLRYQKYDGGKKIDGSLANIEEWELGTEWQPTTALELTAAYALSDRLTQSSVENRSHEKGQLVRLQAQFNY